MIVFLGPTLDVAEARTVLDALYLPPVSQGDVLRAVLAHGPSMIGIVDGFFEQVPAVWHKELLWAMEQGVHLYGSASMGALRAAELHSFGMVGVGRIFEDFRDGVLEDDDEVAVVHGPPDLGYRPLSEAMVNIRASLRGRPDGEALIAWAKQQFYPDRTWAAVEARAGHAIPRRDQKREDALEMLRRMRAHAERGVEPMRVSWRMETTVFWDALYRSEVPEAVTPAPPPA